MVTVEAFRVVRRVGGVASTHTPPTRQTLFETFPTSFQKRLVFCGLHGRKTLCDRDARRVKTLESTESFHGIGHESAFRSPGSLRFRLGAPKVRGDTTTRPPVNGPPAMAHRRDATGHSYSPIYRRAHRRGRSTHMTPPRILIIAGSDSGGGAGIQADIKTVTMLGGHAMTAITAVTSQNTTGVKSVLPIIPKEIERQILYTCKDIRPDVIKIGMLHSADVISSIVKTLKKIKYNKIVLDPVMVAKGGARLINKNAIKLLKNKLIKKAFLITPNIPEAEVLTNTKIENFNDMLYSINLLSKLGVKNILLKGGHLNSNYSYDILLTNKKLKIFKNKMIKTKNTHGTGCTLSSAIATFLSCGKPLKKSCELGIKYVNQAIKSNLTYGRGNGPINHLNSFNLNREFL